MPHRSRAVEQPGTWGVWVGAVSSGEKPLQSVKREMREELGMTVQHSEPKLLYIFKAPNSTFQYFNYLVTVEDEFEPILNWETQGFLWVTLAEMKSLNLHFGVLELLKHNCLK
jgi:8-oxo-dGTP pyrophosphatase MutT (NUDIX family)